jgi:thiamine kinase-like enzyme
MALTLEEAIARVPQWASADDLRVIPLGGGITNCNYRIDLAGVSYVLRLPGADTELLGINRQDEYRANLIAGKLGIAPEVYFFIQPEGYLVTRFFDGRPILPDELSQPENIRRVMQAVQRIHRMPSIPGSFNVFRAIRSYTGIAQRYHVDFPENFDGVITRLHEAEKALSIHPYLPCPCHNDLLNANFLTNGKLIILDWEYAGMGDKFFDLANFSDHHNLSDQQCRWMLECYFDGTFRSDQWAHLKIMQVLSDLREATWGLVQVGISKLDFDFHAYAEKFFSRVMENISNPHWNDYLKEVSEYV